MPRPAICVLGGTGFVGRHLAARLAEKNFNVKILTRSRARHYDLVVLPTVTLVDADVHDVETLKREFAGCDAVVNLVGILNERGHRGRGFHHIHVELARKVLEACQGAVVPRLLHMSALNAAANAPSHYLRSKAEAAALVLEAAGLLHVTVFEPSVIFGPGDSFINRFAKLLRRTPGIFPLACPKAKFSPVYAGDVAEAFARSLDERASFGKRYCLCGPKTYTLRELVRYTTRLQGLHRLIVGLPRPLSWLQAAVMEWLPGKPFSLDNYHSLKLDSVYKENDFAAFGIEPVALEAVVPIYLGKLTMQAEFDKFRRMRNGHL
ncbi:MAG: complex I NDUFA9 subunit family protein [Gammaproteobacteria bacterium]